MPVATGELAVADRPAGRRVDQGRLAAKAGGVLQGERVHGAAAGFHVGKFAAPRTGGCHGASFASGVRNGTVAAPPCAGRFSIVSWAWFAIRFSQRWRGDDGQELRVRVLGGAELALSGRPLAELASAKAAALLFYLAVTRDD